MATASPDSVGRFLEKQATNEKTVFYSDVIRHFEDLPELAGGWAAHPLCEIFDVLDQQDASGGRPFRTSVVVSMSDNMPGPGFFEALEKYKGVTAKSRDEHTDAWMNELQGAFRYPWA